LSPFRPFFRNPHLSTLAGNFWPRRLDEARFPTRAVLYQTEPATQVLVHENRPPGPVRGEALLLHGLEGSSAGGYMVSLAQNLLEAGYAVHRVNMRGCGDTEHLTDTLYHAGLTQDLRWLAERLAGQGRGPVFLVGFSLGGNVVLKLAGEWGAAARGLAAGVCAVSTPIDLHACVRRMSARENLLYEARFITRLRARYKLRRRTRPERFPAEGLKGAWTVYDFDDRITAPHFGFGTAANYYALQSSFQYLPRIQAPTLLLQAEDDPLIPFDLFRHPSIAANPALRLHSTAHGGHLGFIARAKPRFWADPVIVRWISEVGNNQGAATVSFS
jgi:predicted alpha/beta-fold hydrolase